VTEKRLESFRGLSALGTESVVKGCCEYIIELGFYVDVQWLPNPTNSGVIDAHVRLRKGIFSGADIVIHGQSLAEQVVDQLQSAMDEVAFPIPVYSSTWGTVHVSDTEAVVMVNRSQCEDSKNKKRSHENGEFCVKCIDGVLELFDAASKVLRTHKHFVAEYILTKGAK